MIAVYMAHPLSGSTPEETKANLERARRWFRWLFVEHGAIWVPVANWIVCSEVLDDYVPWHRTTALDHDCELVKRCDLLLLVGGRITRGMKVETDAAIEHGKPVIDWTYLGEEPPLRSPRIPML